MNEQKINQLFELQKSVNELNVEINAEINHGVGFDGKEKDKEFIEYFDTFFNKVNEEYNKMKSML